jgi:hypothetical protein
MVTIYRGDDNPKGGCRRYCLLLSFNGSLGLDGGAQRVGKVKGIMEVLAWTRTYCYQRRISAEGA